MKRLALVLSALLAACPPKPAPSPGPDASDASAPPCAAACANLQNLGCPEGAAANCVQVCERASLLTNLQADKLAAAKTKEEARAVGSVTCP